MSNISATGETQHGEGVVAVVLQKEYDDKWNKKGKEREQQGDCVRGGGVGAEAGEQLKISYKTRCIE